MKKNMGLIILGLILFVSQRAYCWGDEGHEIVAIEAQQLLEQQSKKGDAKASQALKTLQEILGKTKIDEASVWPDQVKNLARNCEKAPYVKDPDYGKVGYKGKSSAICDAYKYTSSWHFVNTDAAKYTSNPKDPNYFKGDAVVIVRGLYHLLRGEPTPTLNGVSSFSNWKEQCLKKADHNCKKEALEFLIHIVGDTHQPLHSGSLCDYGGNNQYILFFGQEKDPGAFWCKPTDPATCNNHELHQAWDTNLLIHDPGNQAFVSPEDYANKLLISQAKKKQSTDAQKCVKTAPQAVVHVDAANGPASWINESLCYVPQAYIFPDDTTAQVKTKKRNVAQIAREIPNRCRADHDIQEGRNMYYTAYTVANKYFDANIMTINERLYWGGQRLASLLKDIYGNGDKLPKDLN